MLLGYFKICVGDKYLVTIGQEEIHLFTANGEYLCKIVKQGRGPEEFTSIWGYCLDESENRLYLADVSQIIVIVDIAFENKDLFILADAEIEVKRKENIVTSWMEYLGYYVYQKSEAELKDFYVDLLDNSYKNYFPLNVVGRKVCWNINIADFKRQLKDKLDERLSLSKERREIN